MPALKLTTTVGSQYTDVGFHRTDAYGAKLLAGSSSLAGTAARFAVAELTNDIRTLGFIGRQQIAWRDRVFLTGGIRTDKNSAFGANFDRVAYPSLSASWVASEESFFPKVDAHLVSAPPRGHRLGGAESGLPRGGAVLLARRPSIVGGQDVPAFTIGGAGNNSLKPEKSTERELGFDLGLCSATGSTSSYTHYNKLTKDALVNVNNAPSLGTSPNRFINVGRVQELPARRRCVRATVFDGPHGAVRHERRWLVDQQQARGPRHRREWDDRSRSSPAASTQRRSTESGLPLGAYYAQARVVRRRERRQPDRLPGRPRNARAASSASPMIRRTSARRSPRRRSASRRR